MNCPGIHSVLYSIFDERSRYSFIDISGYLTVFTAGDTRFLNAVNYDNLPYRKRRRRQYGMVSRRAAKDDNAMMSGF